MNSIETSLSASDRSAPPQGARALLNLICILHLATILASAYALLVQYISWQMGTGFDQFTLTCVVLLFCGSLTLNRGNLQLRALKKGEWNGNVTWLPHVFAVIAYGASLMSFVSFYRVVL